MFTVGVSAGAGLSLAVARQVVLGKTSADKHAIKGVVSFCPYTLHPDNVPKSYRATYTSYTENKENVPIIEAATMHQFLEYAALQPGDEDYFVALNQKDHGLFPPTYIATCEKDPLRDDGRVMVESLKASGVSVRTDHYAGLPHCFWVFPSLPESQVFLENAVDAVKWVISQV
jgi:versiconal hemiacetal acetate esterase